MEKEASTNPAVRLLQGMLIGTGAVLPGVSGGVLMVIFGLYQPVMALLAHPLRRLREGLRQLLPVLLGIALGFLGIARLLGFLLRAYPEPSVCVFVGMIAGMIPSLFREAGEKGRSAADWAILAAAFSVTLAFLLFLRVVRVTLVPGFGWYVFCGFCLALSVIVPGMSFSTLLMPLGLYTPFIEGIGRLDMPVLIPGGLGAALTMALLARGVAWLLERRYALVFHGVIGVVMAATLVIIPLEGFGRGVAPFAVNLLCLMAGGAAAWALERLNQRTMMPDDEQKREARP